MVNVMGLPVVYVRYCWFLLVIVLFYSTNVKCLKKKKIKIGAGGMVTRDQQAKCLHDDLFNSTVGKLSLGGKI